MGSDGAHRRLYEYDTERVVFQSAYAPLHMALAHEKVDTRLRDRWRILQIFDRGTCRINDERGPDKPAIVYDFVFERPVVSNG